MVSERAFVYTIPNYSCWKVKVLDKGLYTGIMLTDLSKAFDCISHDLLIAKLNVYGFINKGMEIINDYLCKRKQKKKIGGNFSLWSDLIYGVLQGSILGPLLINIYINDIFQFSERFKMVNYADN